MAESYAPTSFSDLQQVSLKEADKGAPSHRILRFGANFEATCKNNNCSLNNRRVWINAGYDKFNMSRVVNRTKCPKCNERVKELNKITVYIGNMIVDGQYTVDKIQMEREENFTHHQRNTYLSFHDIDSQLILWDYLEITVSRLTP